MDTPGLCWKLSFTPDAPEPTPDTPMFMTDTQIDTRHPKVMLDVPRSTLDPLVLLSVIFYLDFERTL